MSVFIGWFTTRALLVAGIVVGIVATLILRNSDWRRFVPWCKEHVQFVAGLGVGAFVGAFVVLLFGTEPTDAIAGLIGAFAGIVAAIAGAIWVYQVQDRDTKERAITSALTALDALSRASRTMYLECRKTRTDMEGRAMLIATAGVFCSAARQFQYLVHRYASQLSVLPRTLSGAHATIEFQIGNSIEQAENITSRGSIGADAQLWAEIEGKADALASDLCHLARFMRLFAPYLMKDVPDPP